MSNSPLVSIRIPPETLERLDNLAQILYPPRRSGRKPNRSQVILDAIEEFLAQHESEDTEETELDQSEIDEKVHTILQKYHKHLEQQIKEYIHETFLAYSYNLEQRLSPHRKLSHSEKK